MVQVIKSLQNPLEVGNNLKEINDNISERGLEQKRFRLTEDRQRRGRDHIVWQTDANGGFGDWVGPTTDGRQFNGWYQQTVGLSRAEGTPTRTH